MEPVQAPNTVVRPVNPISPKRGLLIFTLVGILIIGAGIVTGRALSGNSGGAVGTADEGVIKTSDKEVGSKDEKSFPDTAEGTLKEGGVKGEGRFRLERAGGDSQTIALTSTVIDLSLFTDKKVQVWGQTFAGKKAPWNMDVGKIKVLE